MTQTTNAPSATSSAPPTAYAAPPAYGPPPPPRVSAPRPPRPPKPPRPLRRRGLGFAGFVLALGLAALAFGGAMILHDAQGWTTDVTVVALASALGTLGLVILVGGLLGRRAGFTGFIAIVLALITWIAAVTPDLHATDGAGDRTWRPTSATSQDYDLGFGSGTLDLERLTPGTRGEIDAEVGVGELRIEVPAEVTVRVIGEVGGGDIELRRNESSAFDTRITSSDGGLDQRIDRVFGDGEATVTVDASVGFGQLVIIER